MVSLGNEQHQMSIRQPMTTKSLFLYLEDGIPVRTTGLIQSQCFAGNEYGLGQKYRSDQRTIFITYMEVKRSVEL